MEEVLVDADVEFTHMELAHTGYLRKQCLEVSFLMR